MKHKPVKSGTLFERGLVIRVILHGIFIAAAAVSAYQFGITADSHGRGMTMAFLVLAISQLIHALNQRSNTDSVFTRGNAHNKALYGTMLVSGVILALIMLVPALRSFFSLTTLTTLEWMVTLGLSLLPLVLVKITKLVIRHKKKTE